MIANESFESRALTRGAQLVVIYKMNVLTIKNLSLVPLILLCLIGCKNYKDPNNLQSRNTMTKRQVPDNPYVGLRTQAMNATYEQLGLNLKNDNDIYGMIMDWNMGDVIVTVVAFRTGDASVYLSSGQGFIGGHAHDTVVRAAQRFIAKGPSYLAKAVSSTSTAPADKNKIGFYILTKSGKYYIEDTSDKIENNQSPLSDLFSAANEVITEYRLITDNK